jgi:acyl-CoA reductase-like NAD-dependent aldehyde dehydrogenase
MLRENIELVVQALATDLRKPRQEVFLGEIGHIVRRAARSAEQLDEWAKDENVQVPVRQKAWSPTILKCPKGVVLIISCVSIKHKNILLALFLTYYLYNASSLTGPGITPLF